MRTSKTKHPSSDDRGVVALEFVLVFPFLIGLVLAIASFGAFFSKKVEVTSAARDAARTFALGGNPNPPNGMSFVLGKPCAAGDTTSNATVTVTLTGGYTFNIPLIPLGNRPITATGTMRCGG